MTQSSILWRICGAAAAGVMVTTLLAVAVWTGVVAVSRVGTELALALRWASPGL
jgi:hypothetical protein